MTPVSMLRPEGFRMLALPAILWAGLIGMAPAVASAQDDRTEGRDSEVRTVADVISARLRSGGLGDHAIAVWHEDGHVTLDGRVASEEAKRRAGQIAREIDGVQSVENRLRVDLGGANHPTEVTAFAEPEGETSSSAGRVVGGVTVEVEVNVIINSGNVFGPAGPPGRPSSIGDRSDADRDRHVRELEETIVRLRAELESLRDRREPSEFRERFEQMRREAAERAEMARRRAEEMRRNMEEHLRPSEPPREAEDERREAVEEAREPERVDGVRQSEASRERDEQENRDDRAEATSSILPTLFETLSGFDFGDSE